MRWKPVVVQSERADGSLVVTAGQLAGPAVPVAGVEVPDRESGICGDCESFAVGSQGRAFRIVGTWNLDRRTELLTSTEIEQAHGVSAARHHHVQPAADLDLLS